MKTFLLCLLIILGGFSVYPQNVFPLRLGNSWTYLIEHNQRVKITIIDSAYVFNGKKYFLTNHGRLLRLDTLDNIYYYFNFSSNEEVPYYKAGINLNDTVRYFVNKIPEWFYCQNIFSSNVFGQNLKVKLMKHHQSGGLVQNDRSVTDELGMLLFIISPTGNVAYRLLGCVIDGIVYGDTVAVSVDDNFTEFPNEFRLYQNYPNPFNPSTKISWRSPVGSHHTLKIFDVLGREVATLVDEYREAGYHEVEFNVAQTISLCSGVYFYQLKVGNFVQTKKMILMR